MPSLSRAAAVLIALVALSIGPGRVRHLGARSTIPLAGPGPYRFPPHSVRVFRLTAAHNVLQAIHPRSLADLPGRRLRLGSTAHQTPWIAASADGSKIAVLFTASGVQQTTHRTYSDLRVLSARSGKPLTPAEHPGVALIDLGISPDGSLLDGFWGATNTDCPSTSLSSTAMMTPSLSCGRRRTAARSTPQCRAGAGWEAG